MNDNTNFIKTVAQASTRKTNDIAPIEDSNITLGILRKLFPENLRKAHRTPTPKMLRENDRPIIHSVQEGGTIIAYSSGYILYTCEAGYTVIFIDDCFFYDYGGEEPDTHDDINKNGPIILNTPSYSREFLKDLRWEIPVMLWGEKRATRNSMYRASDRKRVQVETADSEGNIVCIWDDLEDTRYPLPEETAISEVGVEKIKQSISSQQWEAARRVGIEGKTQKEAATEMGISDSVVRKKLTRAANNLKKNNI